MKIVKSFTNGRVTPKQANKYKVMKGKEGKGLYQFLYSRDSLAEASPR